MSIYILLYFIVICFLLIIWAIIFKKHWKFLYWKFFMLSMIFYSLWLILYLIAFSSGHSKEILLILSRLLYWLSLLSSYFILMFIYFFSSKNLKFTSTKISIFVLYFFWFFFLLSIFTPFIINDMTYNNSLKIYYESFGILYFFYTILYLLQPFLFTFIWIKRIIKLKSINKIRFKFIFIWFFILLFNVLLFLAILPVLWIWILQKEQILFFIPFIILTLYSINRYHFANIKIWIWKIVIFLVSFFNSLLFINILKYYYSNIDERLISFWQVSKGFWTVDLIFWIIIFLILYNILNKIFLWNNSMIIFERKLNDLKKNIPYITNISELNNFLIIKFDKLFKVNYVNIKIFNKKDNNLQLYKYFSKDISRDIFINDIVFIEENKYKFDLELLKKEIDKKVYLIFPLINNKNELIWIFKLWTKPFGDQYYTEEINSLKYFVNFLLGHLKYLDIYLEINELSINLDKKVDEKTIEYNTLLSKQKEFISMSSHEIKTPVASSIFHIDCLLDSLKDWKINEKDVEKDLNILNNQLLKLWELVNKIFRVQEYDIKKIDLFIEKINLEKLLKTEIESFRKVNKKVKINLNLDETIWFIEIDKVQFKQVIDNLLNNAIKFSSKTNPVINIVSKLDKEKVIIYVEDNWKWFENIDIKTIFDKYISWNISTVWIWMWLYLCKRIIEMHHWNIKATKSNELWWAKFIIQIPNKYIKI